MAKLAINGGPKLRTELFPSQNTMDQAEADAVLRALQNGRLSGYRGNWCPEFMGGPEVQRLEREWQDKFNTKHAIAVNSATSGLHVACGAIGLHPGDEVIVTPYSMTCSATAPMIYGAHPVFADIEPKYYCLDPDDVERKITHRTKAIIVVSLFGQPYDPRINELARTRGLYVIEDAAQAPGATRDGQYAGTLGDIGVYSFNFGKHINCGEGGMIVTNNPNLAMKCQLIRNHAEAVVNGMSAYERHLYNRLIGFNMRMTELQAAVVNAQLKKFDMLLRRRLANVNILQNILSPETGLAPISISPIRPNCTHTYYVLAFQWDAELAYGIHRDVFIDAVKAELTEREGREGEGVPIGCGYIQPLYRMPLFQYNDYNNQYEPGSCPVCEDLWANRLFLTLYHAPNTNQDDMIDVGLAFEKVWLNIEELVILP